MKTTGQKLRKVKTKQVYGFKKEPFNSDGNGNIDPTYTITTITQIMKS